MDAVELFTTDDRWPFLVKAFGDRVKQLPHVQDRELLFPSENKIIKYSFEPSHVTDYLLFFHAGIDYGINHALNNL
jgi:hypothetical protein